MVERDNFWLKQLCCMNQCVWRQFLFASAAISVEKTTAETVALFLPTRWKQWPSLKCPITRRSHVSLRDPQSRCGTIAPRSTQRSWQWAEPADRDPKEWVRNCLGNPFFFSGFFLFFGWGWFWGCPGSFLGKPRGETQVRGGGFRAAQAPFWGNQWWNQVSSRFGHEKTASKSKSSRSFLFSVCIYLCWSEYVCVFVIEYVVCVFFLLLFWFFIQCTSFLVFAIYLFNVSIYFLDSSFKNKKDFKQNIK